MEEERLESSDFSINFRYKFYDKVGEFGIFIMVKKTFNCINIKHYKYLGNHNN